MDDGRLSRTSLSNLWQPHVHYRSLTGLDFVEAPHPPRNWSINRPVRLSHADDLVERGFVLYIDWKGAVGMNPPPVFLFPLASENKASNASAQ